MNQFLLLIRGDGTWDTLTKEQKSAIIANYGAWAKKLRDQDRLVEAAPLRSEGHMLFGGETITDGPFVETKEMIGGFFLYRAADLQEAVAIARECPAMTYGGFVEIRPVQTQGD